MKKIISLVMVIAMIAALGITVSADETPAVPTDGLLAYFSFDDAESGLAGGGAVATPHTYTKNGSAYEEADADPTLTADGKVGGAYQFSKDDTALLRVTDENGDPIFSGLDSFTISYWTLNNTAATTNWGFFIKPADANGDLIAPENEPTYIGLLQNTTYAFEYFNHGRTHSVSDRDYGPVVAGEWQLITVTLTDEDGEMYLILYIDGEYISDTKLNEDTAGYPDEILGDDYYFLLGGASWGNGEFLDGMIDEFYVWDHGMTEDEIVALAVAMGADVKNSGNNEPADDETTADNSSNTPADDVTTAADATTTAAPATTTAAPATTTAASEEKGGCGSTLGAAAAIVALTSVFGCAIVKKH